MHQFIAENLNKSTTHAPPRPDAIKHTRLHHHVLTFDGYQVLQLFARDGSYIFFCEEMGSIRNFSLFLLFVFNTIFNNFTAIYLGSVSLLQKTRVPGEKAIDLPHLTHKLNHIQFRQVHSLIRQKLIVKVFTVAYCIFFF